MDAEDHVPLIEGNRINKRDALDARLVVHADAVICPRVARLIKHACVDIAGSNI